MTGGFDLDGEMISPNPLDEDAYRMSEMAFDVPMSSTTMWSGSFSSGTRKSAYLQSFSATPQQCSRGMARTSVLASA